jgi:predicted glycogen debranching enzyme
MGYLEFEKEKLINLEYSLNKETLRTNRSGAYGSSTIINCNTRKYHGFFVCPMDKLDGEHHVLISTLDETIMQQGKEFHLAVHRYPGIFHPGHKYLREYEAEPIPTHVFTVGGVVLKREKLLVGNEPLVLVRYTLEEANSPTKIRLHPFLAFRSIHKLCKANWDVSHFFEPVENGIRTRMYDAYPFLYMQLSKNEVEYIHAPDWFYNIEYPKEQERGYESHEDLYVPGFFEFEMKKGEQIIFSAGLKETSPKKLKALFTNELKKRTPRNNFENCLENAAQQFFDIRNGKTEIISGFPWFNKWGRDTFIALPGLTLSRKDPATCKAVLDTMSNYLDGSLFKMIGNFDQKDINAADAPLWYIWAIQRYAYETGQLKEVWKAYSSKICSIVKGYKKGTKFGIKMLPNGLLTAGEEGIAATWMDIVVKGKPVTPRTGLAVELNALWYNAVSFCHELAIANDAKDLLKECKDLPEKIQKSFVKEFWDEKLGYLADYIQGGYKDFSVRPNMAIAVGLPFNPLDDEMTKSVLDKVQQELMTPRGLRTLSPQHPDYKGVCEGDVLSRDIAYHQGPARPWLLEFFATAYLKIHEKTGISYLRKIYEGFEPVMWEHGIGTVSELYDGNPPYLPHGAISQALNVAALIRLKELITIYENK